MNGNEEFWLFLLAVKHKHFVNMLCLPCDLNGKFEQHLTFGLLDLNLTDWSFQLSNSHHRQW